MTKEKDGNVLSRSRFCNANLFINKNIFFYSVRPMNIVLHTTFGFITYQGLQRFLPSFQPIRKAEP
nr:hypothetical protein MarFTME_018 [Marseillevirus futianmevirus]